jgi:PAS domain S-box-containing protein
VLFLLHTLRTLRNSSIFSGIATGIETHSKVLRYVLIFVSSVLLSLFVYLLSFHFSILDFYILAFDIISIILLSLIFFTTWYNYTTNNQEINIIGFGFLFILMNSILFLCFYSEMGLKSSLYINLKSNYELINKLIKAIILFASLSGVLHFKLNKLNNLIITILISVIISLAIYVFPAVFPHLSDYFTITLVEKSVIYFLINSFSIILFSCSIYIVIRKTRNFKYHKLSYYRYIFWGLLASLANSICFTLYILDIAYFLILGYLLETISCFCFFKAFHVDNEINLNKRITNVIKCSQKNECINEFLNIFPSGAMVFDKDLKFEFMNKKLENLLGYRLEELYDLHLETILQKFSIIDINLLPVVSLADYEIICKMLQLGKDNKICIVNRFKKKIILSVRLYDLSNGNILVILSEDNNILEFENVKLQTAHILDSINSFVVIVDKSSKIVSCNRLFYELTGIKPGNAIGMTLSELYKLLNISFMNTSSVEKAYTNGYFKARVVTITSVDKEKKHIIFRISPVRDVGDKNNGYIIIGSDITLLKEEQQNVQHQEKLALIGQLGSGIVHETKNMLASIKGYCQLIYLKSDSNYVKNHTKRIEEITNEVNKIITEFLAFSKPTPQIFNAVLLNEIILSVKYMLESPSFIKGVKLELNLTEFEKPVFADEFQIKQVILNMAKNAIEAMDETNTPLLKISTSLSNSNKEMILKISDNGKGLPKVDLSKLCKPFYTTKEYGTGLGLSTCYRIIKEHNGKISFESKIGKGTTFTIFIPCKSDTKNH